MERKPVFSLLLVFLAVAAQVAGCTTGHESEHQDLSPSTSPAVFTVALDDTSRLESRTPAQLMARYGSDMLELQAVAERPGKSWGLAVGLTEGDLNSDLKVSLSQTPIRPGVGTAQIGDPSSTTFATSGVVEVRIAGGMVSGKLAAVPASLSGKFEGQVQLACFVPPEQLPAPPSTGGVVPDTPGTVLVQDTSLASPFCQRIAQALR